MIDAIRKIGKIHCVNANGGTAMNDTYLDNDTYFRLIAFLLDSPLGTILGHEARDMLTMRLGLDAGIWPESTRPEDSFALNQ